MLGFIPMNKKATIYHQGEVDAWGQPSLTKSYTGKCQILYNTDMKSVSGKDGVESVVSCTIVFHGLVTVTVGDYVEFTTHLGVTEKYPATDVFFFEDWAGKIVATRVVIGNGKRS